MKEQNDTDQKLDGSRVLHDSSDSVGVSARLASSIIWTEHIQSSALAVCLPEVFLIINTSLLILCHIICGCWKCKWDNRFKKWFQHYTSFLLHICLHLDSSTSSFHTYVGLPNTNDRHIDFVLYLFATTIFSANLFNIICRNYRGSSSSWTLFVYGGAFTLFWILMLYLLCIAILFLYSLMVGNGSAVSTGPLAVISLLPSILVSGIAWIVKIFTLDKTKDTAQHSQDHRTIF